MRPNLLTGAITLGSGERSRGTLSRRDFLKLGGALGSTAAVPRPFFDWLKDNNPSQRNQWKEDLEEVISGDFPPFESQEKVRHTIEAVTWQLFSQRYPTACTCASPVVEYDDKDTFEQNFRSVYHGIKVDDNQLPDSRYIQTRIPYITTYHERSAQQVYINEGHDWNSQPPSVRNRQLAYLLLSTYPSIIANYNKRNVQPNLLTSDNNPGLMVTRYFGLMMIGVNKDKRKIFLSGFHKGVQELAVETLCTELELTIPQVDKTLSDCSKLVSLVGSRLKISAGDFVNFIPLNNPWGLFRFLAEKATHLPKEVTPQERLTWATAVWMIPSRYLLDATRTSQENDANDILTFPKAYNLTDRLLPRPIIVPIPNMVSANLELPPSSLNNFPQPPNDIMDILA